MLNGGLVHVKQIWALCQNFVHFVIMDVLLIILTYLSSCTDPLTKLFHIWYNENLVHVEWILALCQHMVIMEVFSAILDIFLT